MLRDTGQVIGLTDDGAPIVLADYNCEHFKAGSHPMLASRTCWYCRYADFRKSTDIFLEQSICRCPENRFRVDDRDKNERNEKQGGETNV